MLGVPVASVEAWEAGSVEVDRSSWLTLARIVVDTIGATTSTVERRTLADVLAMLDGPILLADTDIAEALGIVLGPMRARLDAAAP
jgi:hypothetical protein